MATVNAISSSKQADGHMRRRDFLKAALGTVSLAAVARPSSVGDTPADSWAWEVCRYLESLRRPDGGYAWADQAQSHLTPSFAAVGCYRSVLRSDPPDKGAIVQFLRTHHPFAIKKLERDLPVFDFQQIQGLLWLDQDVSSFREQVKRWTKPSVYPAVYEKHTYPVLQMEVMALLSRQLAGLPMEGVTPAFAEYIEVRRRPNGSFNNTPAADGGDGHVMNTWWAIQALEAMGRPQEKREETIGWVRSCQRPDGGFTWQPKPSFAGVEDVIYTWTAVQVLKHFDAAPADREACIKHVLSLRNADGGFGPRPGWPSNPEATYRALEVLHVLNALDRLAPSRASSRLGSLRVSLPQKSQGPRPSDNLQVFTIQIEAHGNGSCAEAVEIARALRIDLWGAKNAPAGWIVKAQSLADRRQVPVKFFVANEEYSTFVDVPGLGTYSHTSDIIAPAGADFGTSLAGKEAVSWEQFRQRRLAPLNQAGGRLVWQFGENEELTRLYLDDSLQRGGYAAISTFHFGNPDFTNSEPFLKHYWQQIPFIGLQDAHGGESWWWLDQLTGFRTLFLATEPTWEDWLTALKNNWVVAVRHDQVSSGQTWMHGGAPEVLDFVRRREQQWRWWDNPSMELPLVSVVAVTPDDQWEKARPKRGVTIRVRCRWDNTTQGLPKTQRVELLKLAIDGQEVTPILAAPRAKQGAYQDHYHYHNIPEPTAGKHTATATIRVLATKAESSHTIEFTV
jgi:hypothetical protein